jgi:hypothetical protein
VYFEITVYFAIAHACDACGLTDVLITSGKVTHDDCTVTCMIGFSKETKFVFMGLSKSSKTGI